MVGDGIVSGHVDTFNFVNRVKIANGSLWGITGPNRHKAYLQQY